MMKNCWKTSIQKLSGAHLLSIHESFTVWYPKPNFWYPVDIWIPQISDPDTNEDEL
jgi:hypothetical protein